MPSSPSPSPALSPTPTQAQAPDAASTRAPSLTLHPPATIVSPPSPIDPTHSLHAFLSPSSSTPVTPESETEPQAYDSPEEDDSIDDVRCNTLSPVPSRTTPYTRSLSSSSRNSATPIAATQMSLSPKKEPSLLAPSSPCSVAMSPSNSGDRLPLRAPSPSSPHYRPKPTHHRRTSSTHRVRETIGGEQTSTENGERMVNQYKIGKSLGSGAYAKVELGVDVGTGQEYAIKEFSKSRLKLQALQHKQRQTARSRPRRPPPPGQRGQSQGSSDSDGKQASDEQLNMPRKSTGPWGEAGEKTMEEDPLGLVRREIAIMKKLDHPNIVHLYEAISMPNADALFLVLEYLPGGTLMDVAMGPAAADAKPPFEMWQTREYFRQLCLGLEYLHANEVVHRDIKPENILLSKDRTVVKLCDFGVSEMFDAKGSDRIKKAGGSPAFLSPESFTSSAEVHGQAVDVWALGVTLYCMLTGRLPFNVENPIELFDVVKTQEPELDDDWDPQLRDLLQGMLKKDPHERATVAHIRDHPWVTENGENAMISTEDNLYYVGKHVEEPTQDELRSAIGSLRSIFTVVRAVQKMRRLGLHRRSMSGQSQSASATPTSPLALPSSPETSTNPSLRGGSMDSYASIAADSDTTADPDEKWKDIIGTQDLLSPRSIDSGDISPGGTQKLDTLKNPFDELKPISTDVKVDEEEVEGETVFASPTSEEGTPVS